ncbi:MAG: glucose-1-phosphate thymidylyltransferase [Muribaculaceae bacterium]|nr:glucose-1-phosphate thymidylyltransferase [Muribaculaceae bacterium]
MKKTARNVILFDDNELRKHLMPFTYTRPAALLRIGITTIADKWQAMLGEANYSYLTVRYLKKKYPLRVRRTTNLLVAGHVIPTPALAKQVLALEAGEALMSGEELIAFNGSAQDFDARHYTRVVYPRKKPLIVRHLYDIFEFNAEVLKQDFDRLTAGRESQPLSASNTVIGDPSRIFIEEGAYVEGAMLNTQEGPIYIGKDVEVMEGACIRGGFSACHDAKVRIGAKVYGATTLGPYCKIGGEVENSVFIGYSNKAHEGFLGDAVIGEWCNIGGGTTASNLKNDYGEIKLWNYASKRFERTGLQFCGLFMGDHSKIGVNGMINTATVLGVGVNIHGTGFPRNFVASFQEGSASAGFKNVPIETFYTIAERVMARRGVTLTEIDRDIYKAIYSIRDKYK